MKFNKDNCTGCGSCVEFCPNAAITLVNGIPQVDEDKCYSNCNKCISSCYKNCITK